MLTTVLVSASVLGGLIFAPGDNTGPLEPIYYEQGVVGTFHNETYSLTLENLPTHSDIWVGFNLETIGNWQGTASGDVFTFNYDNNLVPPVLTSFANAPGFSQAFPDRYPDGTRPAQYLAITATPNESALYVNAGQYPHTADSVTLTFTGASDKEWILSNLTVSLVAVPEPSSFALALFAGLSLLGVRRQRECNARSCSP